MPSIEQLIQIPAAAPRVIYQMGASALGLAAIAAAAARTSVTDVLGKPLTALGHARPQMFTELQRWFDADGSRSVLVTWVAWGIVVCALATMTLRDCNMPDTNAASSLWLASAALVEMQHWWTSVVLLVGTVLCLALRWYLHADGLHESARMADVILFALLRIPSRVGEALFGQDDPPMHEGPIPTGAVILRR